MIKAVTFSYVGDPRQGREVVIDDEKNIDARIEALCHRGVRHYEHTDPVDVPLEKIDIQQLTARDVMNLVKLGVQEQYEEQFSRFTDKFKRDSVMQEFQFEHDECNTECTPNDVEKILADIAKSYDDYTSGRISVIQAVDIINKIKFIRFLNDAPKDSADLDAHVDGIPDSTNKVVDVDFPIEEVDIGWSVTSDKSKYDYIGEITNIDKEYCIVTYKLNVDGTSRAESFGALKGRVFPF